MSKENLTQFLNSMLDKDDETATSAFHNYLKDKMKSIIHPQASEEDIEVNVKDSESSDSNE